MVMRAFQKIQASKKGLEGEGIGNNILFGTVSKKSLWMWSRRIIWSEIFLTDHTGYCIRNRCSGNQSEGSCKKYCVVCCYVGPRWWLWRGWEMIHSGHVKNVELKLFAYKSNICVGEGQTSVKNKTFGHLENVIFSQLFNFY